MAKKQFRMLGMSTVMRKLKTEVDKIEGRTLTGLVRATIIIRTSSVKDTPRVPFDTGNLQSSWFTSMSAGVPEANANTGNFKGKNSSHLATGHQRIKQVAEAKTKQLNRKRNPVVLFGYSANYAVFAHERYTGKVNWKRPNSGPGFLISSIKAKQKECLEIIRREAQI